METFLAATAASLVAALLALYLRHRRLKQRLLQSQALIRQQTILSDVGSLLASSLDINSVVETLLDGAKYLSRAQLSAVLLTEGARVKTFHTSMGPAEGCKPRATGILERVLKERLPVRAKRLSSHEAFQGLPDRHPAIESILAVPIILRDRTIGELIVANKTGSGEGFSSEDEDALLALGFQAALALEKAHLHEEVEALAITDGLTGLYNHRAFQERLEAELGRSGRFGHPLSLLMLDVDDFKRFNDTYGHQAGDRALRAVAEAVRSSIRSVDFAARYGGEEFAVLLLESPPEKSLDVAERIRQCIEGLSIKVDGSEARITVSIGVAHYPGHARDRQGLLRRADEALYIAKQRGKNQVAVPQEGA